MSCFMLARTFSWHEFSTLSVLENLMMVPGDQPGERLFDAEIPEGKVVLVSEKLKKAHEVADFLNLGL